MVPDAYFYSAVINAFGKQVWSDVQRG
jgi:hypothetical protein